MPQPTDLTDLATLKAYIHCPSGVTTDDSLLDRLITMATGQIETYCRRKLKQRQLVEEYDGTGTSHLVLREYPVTALSEVNVDPQRRFASTTVISLDTLALSGEEGRISFIGAAPQGAIFPAGTKCVRVTYTAGYATVPADLELACLKLAAAHFFRSREGGDGIAAESLGGHSITWTDGMPQDVVELLLQYRRNV